MFTSYEETVRYLYDALPMFQRIGSAALKNDLSNTIAICRALGNPQEKFRCIHVAGTNGKGSTSHMLASVLQAAGYKTGLYTSPHLKSFTERIRINGREVTESFVVEFVTRTRPLIEQLQPSFFEITVAMAFDYFAAEKIDIAVIEVGMGGRLDSTNIITPLLSIITNIGWDHKELLGDTLELIAGEKAGIIKAGIPVVVSERQPEVADVFQRKSRSMQAPIIFANDIFSASPAISTNGLAQYEIWGPEGLHYAPLSLDLLGDYQRSNILGVMAALRVMSGSGWNIPENAIRQGLARVATSTGLKGRWQVVGSNPTVVCDTAHNTSGIGQVVAQLNKIPYHHLHLVIGMVSDKDSAAMLRLFPEHASYYFCQASIPRALDAAQLAEIAASEGRPGIVIPDVNVAIDTARKAARPDDLVFVGGSTFVVAEISNL
jgi:dihydrofolate synthase/folylpolyglutamate synthase